jgi:hypothetical protein
MSKAATTFTGRKLDWLKCVAYDRQLKQYPFAFKVAFVIAQHVNEKNGTAFVSDEAIADKAGGGSVRNVGKARVKLRETGWLTWQSTQTANLYTLHYEQMNGVLDLITIASDKRREQRGKRLAWKHRDRNHSSEHEPPDRNHSSQHDRNHSSYIHLRGTPSEKRDSQE